MESPSSCTEKNDCHKATEPVSTAEEIPSCQHPISATLNVLETSTAQVEVQTIVPLQGIPVSEYREQLQRQYQGRDGKEDKFFLCWKHDFP